MAEDAQRKAQGARAGRDAARSCRAAMSLSATTPGKRTSRGVPPRCAPRRFARCSASSGAAIGGPRRPHTVASHSVNGP